MVSRLTFNSQKVLHDERKTFRIHLRKLQSVINYLFLKTNQRIIYLFCEEKICVDKLNGSEIVKN